MSTTARRGAGWVYEGVWAVLTDLFQVPRDPPKLPTAFGGAAMTLRPCDAWLNYRKTVFWIACLAIDLALGALWLAILAANSVAALVLLLPWLAVMVVPDVIAYVAVHLRYDTTWYVLSDRSMRIRRGVWSIHETTITFENIQNVRVTQGPLQRYFGFSDLVVETAGGGGGGGPHGGSAHMGAHVGIIEGVADPASLRDAIMDRVRASRGAGLGDDRTEITVRPGAGWTPASLAALKDLARETAAWRTALE